MRSRILIGLGFVGALGLSVQACGSDDGTTAGREGDADASTSGGSNGATNGATNGASTAPGGNGTGGGSGTGGGGGALQCDTSPCEGMQGTPCCVDESTCGIDISGLAMGLGGGLGGQVPQCIDPSSFQTPDGGFGNLFGDGGFDFGGGVPVLDGGVVVVEGGAPILLDESCSGILLDNQFAPTTLPGCCLPDGTCGGSTHELAGLGLGAQQIPLQCASYDQVEQIVSGGDAGASGGFNLGQFIDVPDDPMETCEYSPPGEGPDNGGGADAGAEPADASVGGDGGS